MKFVVLGLSHHTAPIDVRERIAKAITPVEATLAALPTDVIQEACLVSTCNRVEFYAAGREEPQMLGRTLRSFIRARSGLSAAELEPHLFEHHSTDGLRHLFRVSCSLDSMVLGEPQILGQVKQAFQVAQTAQTVGGRLNRVFERAFAVAKKVRSETGIAENAVSMSFAAVELGREIFSSLEGKNVLVIGAGKMSALAARHLRSNGVDEIRVANRSLERAMKLAKDIGATASSLNDLEMLLAKADIVISSTAAPGYVVSKKLMSKVVRQRRYRPILFVDIAVPRDIDPDIDDLENVFVYDVDDIQEVVEDNRRARAHEAVAAEQMIDAEIGSFLRWARSQQVVPVIKALRESSLAIAEAEAQRTLASMPNLPAKEEKRVRAMSQAIVNKMLHPVMTRLKEEGADGDPGALVDALRNLFDLQIHSLPPPPQEESDAQDNVVSIKKKSNS